MAGIVHSPAFPFVVVWVGRFSWNSHLREELSAHRSADLARQEMLSRKQRWEQFFGQPLPLGIWRVVDIRDYTVVAEAE